MATAVDDSGRPDGVGDGRRERWVQHRANRRAALVAATIEAIDHTATGSPTFDDVAASAGVSRTVLYRYFTDLEDLQQAAAGQLADDLIARVLGPLGEGRTARDIIDSVLDGIAGWVEQHPRRYGFLRQFAAGAEAAAGVSGHMERVEDTVAARLAGLLTLFMTSFGMPADTAELGARALIGLVESSMVWWGRQPVESRQTRAELVAAVSLYVWAAIDAELRANGVVLGWTTRCPKSPREPGGRVTDTDAETPGDDGYTGPVTLVHGDTVVEAHATLRGQVDTIAGSYHWYGRIAADPAVTALAETAGRDTVTLRTPVAEAATALGAVDPWGRFRVEGRGHAPFDVLTDVPGSD